MASMSGFRSFFPPPVVSEDDAYAINPVAEKTDPEDLASAMAALDAERLNLPKARLSAYDMPTSPLPSASLFPKQSANPFPQADLLPKTLSYSAPAVKAPNIEPTLTRTADKATGTTITKPTEIQAPSMGAGGDEGPDRLSVAEALSRGLGAFHEGVTGQKLATGIPEMLATLRQRREAQALKESEIAREDKRTREEMALKRETLQRDVEKAAAQQSLKDRLAGIDPESTQQRLEYAASVEPEDKEFARLLRAGPIKGNDFIRARKEWENLGLLKARIKTEAEKPEQTRAKTRQANATAARMEFLSSPAGIAAARKNTEKQDQALDKALGGRFSGLGLNPAQQEAATRAVAQNRQELGKVTAPFAEVVTALKNAEKAAANMKEISAADVLKARAPGGIGEAFMSDAAKDLQKAQQSLTDLILRARSGAAITEAEADRLTNLYGVKPFRSISEYKKGLRELKSLMYAKLNAAQSGYAPTGDIDVDRYAALADLEKSNPNFVSYRDPFFKDVGGTGRREAIKPNAQTSDMVRIRRKGGTEVKRFTREQADQLLQQGGYEEAP